MSIMSNTWYLPDEQLTYENYPEVARLLKDINDITTYTKRIISALADYSSGTFDKVDVNTVIAQNYVDKCRDVLASLGTANNVCYDITVELRNIQRLMQYVIYLQKRFGSQYIGTPTYRSDRDTI